MLSAREQVKFLLLREKMTVKELAEELDRHTDKSWTRQSLSSKLSRETLKYNEILEIAKLLGYEIEFKKT